MPLDSGTQTCYLLSISPTCPGSVLAGAPWQNVGNSQKPRGLPAKEKLGKLGASFEYNWLLPMADQLKSLCTATKAL